MTAALDAPMSALDRLRGEIEVLSDSLRGARLEELNARAADLERRLPQLVVEVRGDGREAREDEVTALCTEMLRLAALLDGVASYGRARLALEKPLAEAYGPSGAAHKPQRQRRLQEA